MQSNNESVSNTQTDNTALHPVETVASDLTSLKKETLPPTGIITFKCLVSIFTFQLKNNSALDKMGITLTIDTVNDLPLIDTTDLNDVRVFLDILPFNPDDNASIFLFYLICFKLAVIYDHPAHLNETLKHSYLRILNDTDAKSNFPTPTIWRNLTHAFFDLDSDSKEFLDQRTPLDVIYRLNFLKSDFLYAKLCQLIWLRALCRPELNTELTELAEELSKESLSKEETMAEARMVFNFIAIKKGLEHRHPPLSEEEVPAFVEWKKSIENDDEKLTAHCVVAHGYFTGSGLKSGFPNIPKAIHAYKQLMTAAHAKSLPELVDTAIQQLQKLKCAATHAEKKEIDIFLNAHAATTFEEKVVELEKTLREKTALVKKAELSVEHSFFDRKDGRLTESEEKNIDTEMRAHKTIEKITSKQRLEFIMAQKKDVCRDYKNACFAAASHCETLVQHAVQMENESRSSLDSKHVSAEMAAAPSVTTAHNNKIKVIHYYCKAYIADPADEMTLILLGNYYFDGTEKYQFAINEALTINRMNIQTFISAYKKTTAEKETEFKKRKAEEATHASNTIKESAASAPISAASAKALPALSVTVSAATPPAASPSNAATVNATAAGHKK